MDEPEKTDKIQGETPEVLEFMKGLVVGFAAALAIGGALALFSNNRRGYKDRMRPQRRVENFSHDGEALGDVPSQFEDSGGGIVDTIRAVNQTLETGRNALETIKEVMENIRRT